jgi:uncharacterized membrane protein
LAKSTDRLFDMPKHFRLAGVDDPLFTILNLQDMKKNVGKTDKLIRLVVAALILVLLFTGAIALASVLGTILAVVAVIFVFTALVNWCAIYALIGASTCPTSEA